jgi:hypothetical protein
VVRGARNPTRVEEAIKEMKKMEPSIKEDQLNPFVVGLSDLKTVKVAATDVISGLDRVHIHPCIDLSHPRQVESTNL